MRDDLHKLACDCYKLDIPEVELVIAILTPILEEWWLRVIEDALRQGSHIDVVEDGDARARVDGLAALLRFKQR